ncbi:MAG: hypothetical protein OEW12_07845 [Deltaproteobacteria bacterium]|nr:hypothetical protein [Deltaproteobacteria bacterium]
MGFLLGFGRQTAVLALLRLGRMFPTRRFVALLLSVMLAAGLSLTAGGGERVALAQEPPGASPAAPQIPGQPAATQPAVNPPGQPDGGPLPPKPALADGSPVADGPSPEAIPEPPPESPPLEEIRWDSPQIGWITPLKSSQGMAYPLVRWGFETGTPWAETTRFDLDTSRVAYSRGFSFGAPVQWVLRAKGEALTAGGGLDLYHNGRRMRESSYYGNSLGTAFGLRYHSSPQWVFWLEGGYTLHNFFAAPPTEDAFILPSNFSLTEVRTGFEGQFRWGRHGGGIKGELIQATRTGWHEWGLDPEKTGGTRYTRMKLLLNQGLDWGRRQTTFITLEGGMGFGLDLLSGFRVGGVGSEFEAGGHYRNEYPGWMVWMANFRHEIRLRSGLVIHLYYDKGEVVRLDLPYLKQDPSMSRLFSLGAGFVTALPGRKDWKLRFQYREGLLARPDSPDPDRRQVSLVIGEAF